MRNERGITLIALIITIIVLLILAGISISLVVGDNGILGNARNSKASTEIKQAIEQARIGIAGKLAENLGANVTDAQVKEVLNEYFYNVPEDLTDRDQELETKPNRYKVKLSEILDNKILAVAGDIIEDDGITGDIEGYVTDGLILWYDGIQNTRAGNNPNATAWEDLSGNNNDGVFSSAMVANQADITATSKGYYDTTEQGYVFWHNDAYVQSANNLGISGDDNFTFEYVVMPYRNGQNLNYSTSRVYRCPFDYGNGMNNIGLAWHTTSGRIEWGYPNNEALSTNVYDLYNKVTSVSYRKVRQGVIHNGDSDVIKVNVNGVVEVCTYNGTTLTQNLGNSPAYVGRDFQWNNENRPFYGIIKSIRVYDRPLTEAEVQQNYLVDNQRYLKNIFTVDKTNKRINIDTANVQNLKYISGKETDANAIKTSGQTINFSGKTAILNLTKNGQYSFLVTDKLGQETVKIVQAEGMDLYTGYQINNTELSYKRIITVGSGEECSTVKEAFDYLCDNGYTDEVAVLLKEGIHNTQDLHAGTSYNILPKYNGMTISVIADSPGSTYMTAGEMMLSENNVNYWIKLKFYRLIFTSPVYTDDVGQGMHLDGDKENNEYYNCVFLTKVGGWNGACSAAAIGTYNCLFTGGTAGIYSSYPLNGESINSASTNANIDPCNGTKTTCLTNVTVDANYHITSNGWENTGTGTNPNGTQANIGVYGGEFAW